MSVYTNWQSMALCWLNILTGSLQNTDRQYIYTIFIDWQSLPIDYPEKLTTKTDSLMKLTDYLYKLFSQTIQST